MVDEPLTESAAVDLAKGFKALGDPVRLRDSAGHGANAVRAVRDDIRGTVEAIVKQFLPAG